MGASRLIATICLAGLTTGCSNLTALWEDRYGPNPVFDPVEVQNATDRQIEVLRAFALGANLPWPPPPRSLRSDYWYQLTLAGFNVVDDACTRYMEDLFGWERKRNRTKDLLTLAAASTAAILGVTGAGKKSLVIIAEAFGFATGATTIFADSYLFKLHPSTIQSIELKLQEAYRNTVASEPRRTLINREGAAVAYQHVRGYLTLCLPVTLEHKIEEHLARSTAGQQVPGTVLTAAPAAVIMTAPAGAGTPNIGLQ